MSRYSSNFALSFWVGRSPKKRTPASAKPSRLKPPILNGSGSVWAEAAPAVASTASPTRTDRTVRVVDMAAPLPCEGEAGRVIRAVDVHVTRQAGLSQYELERGGIPPVRSRGVLRRDVTLLTQPRLRHLQHVLVIRAMRVVAVGAALDLRRVIPQEGPALLGVAPEAGVIERRLIQQRRRHRPVRVVARGAGHLPLAQRHVRRPHRLGPPLDVAAAAGLDHRLLGELEAWGDVLHDLVAVRAGHVPRLVRATLPEDARALGVAREAHRVALLHRGGVVLREGDQASLALAPARVHVLLAGPVAVLAGVGLVRVARLLEEDAPHPGVGELVERFLVAPLAGLGADVVVAGGHRGRRRRRRRLLRA